MWLTSDRIRKVKCDEKKPSCQKCLSSGRTCDGYSSPFRNYSNQPAKHAYIGSINSKISLQPTQFTSDEARSEEIDLLNRYFSTKTLFDVKLPCDEEARQVLEASLTDPAIRHAVSSLKALRADLETSEASSGSDIQQTSSYHYGLQQYSLALRGLASKLSYPDSGGLKSALLCCQVLISIEQVRQNFAAMALHIIRGLRIMHEYRARPHFVSSDNLAPALYNQLPFLDVFIIKMFAAPCKFTEPSQATCVSERTSSESSSSPDQEPVEPRDLRPLAPNKRSELVKIATWTISFLDKVSRVQDTGNAIPLISEKAALLNSLESWLRNLEQTQGRIKPLSSEPLQVLFMRLFYLVLRIVLLGVLDSPEHVEDELRIAIDGLQSLAINVSERIRAQRTYRGSSSDGGE